MNLVFLDVDGVLNSKKSLIEAYQKEKNPYSKANYPFDHECLKLFYHFVTQTSSKIVLSSCWREYEENIKKLFEVLKEYNLDHELIAFTPDLGPSIPREIEIMTFLDQFGWNHNIVILDDESMNQLKPYAIKTSREIGLTKEDINKATQILLKQQYNQRSR